MQKRKIFTLVFSSLVVALLVFSLVSCTEDDSPTSPTDNNRLIIGTDPAALSARMDYLNEVVEIDSVDTAATFFKGSQTNLDENEVVITLVAEVTPPEHDGTSLQATDVSIHGNKAYVSYNVRGETFLGGVDVFSIQDPDNPQLESSVVFTDTDVNGLYMDGNYLYLASAQEPVNIDSPALLERIQLQGGLPTNNSDIIDLASYAGTDVTVSSNNIYVTSGADGGAVTIIRKNNFAVQATYAINDARGVNVDGDEIAVVAGTPARLIIFEDDIDEPVFDYTLTGASIPFSKSTVEIAGGKAIMALGDGGMQIVCIETGSVVETFEQPDIPDLDPSLTVTNAATADKKLLFMSNGEAGVYMAQSSDRFSSSGCDVDDLAMIGSLRFDDEQSVNHVAYKNGVLFIASGLGGLKICSIEEAD